LTPVAGFRKMQQSCPRSEQVQEFIPASLGPIDMARLPRVAIGTIQPDVDAQPVLWALMESLRRHGLQTQTFRWRASVPAYPGEAAVTGLMPRHLDSWLMSPAMCRDIFLRGVRSADLAVVEGRFRPARQADADGGSLETLCHWLNLPRLVILDVRQLDSRCLPHRPRDVEGVLLDGITSERQLAQVTADLQIRWGLPVLGALERTPELTAQLEALPQGGRLPPELGRELGNRFMHHWYPERIWRLADERDFPEAPLQQLCPEPMCLPLTLAVAYDEAFNGYFPDTLDWLELRGATIVDFSPLRDEALPPGTSVVYLGCGHPERFATVLSENHCMKAALRNHLRAGRRFYAEGGGLAYLCEHLETPRGSLERMVGIIPAVARRRREATGPRATEVVFPHSTWLGRCGEHLRGYRNTNWDLEPLMTKRGFAAQNSQHPEIVGGFQAVGSLVHVNFAAQPEYLRRFFYPHHPQLETVRSWSVGS